MARAACQNGPKANPSDVLLLTEQIKIFARMRGTFPAAIDDVEAVSFAELADQVDSIARGLVARGIKPGDRIGLALTSSVRYLAILYACMAAGAIPCVLNTRLTEAEQERYTARLGLSLSICDDERYDVAPDRIQLEVGGTSLAGLPTPDDAVALPVLDEDAVALIVPTGGTTGDSKGAMLTNRALWLWCASAGAPRQRRPGDLELFFAPFFHVSVVTGPMTTLLYGSTTRIFDRFDPAAIVEAIAAGGTHLGGTPTTYLAIRQQRRFAEIDRSRVRETSYGAMPATDEFVRQLEHDFPNARLRHAYGSTEVGCATLMDHVDIAAARPGVGYPPPGSQITILDANLRPLPAGEIGEIAVTCPWSMCGYWAREEETAQTMSEHGIRTGDLGFLEEDGWLTVAGRQKEMIITGGENVFPNEVENVLIGHPSIRQITVFGVSDRAWGERVEAVVVLEPETSPSPEDIIEFGRRGLAGYKLPKRITFVDAIPLTAVNKPDRRRLSATMAATNV